MPGYYDAGGTVSNGCELHCPLLPHATCTKCAGVAELGGQCLGMSWVRLQIMTLPFFVGIDLISFLKKMGDSKRP